jgi:hypothetical protein
MIAIDALYETAGRAGLLHTAIWRPTTGPVVTAWVDFRAPDESILDGLGVSTDYAIRYPASRLVGLSKGDTLEIEGEIYRVREVRAVGDGSECRATLSRL